MKSASLRIPCYTIFYTPQGGHSFEVITIGHFIIIKKNNSLTNDRVDDVMLIKIVIFLKMTYITLLRCPLLVIGLPKYHYN